MPLGGTVSVVDSASFNVTGNRKLANTATTAASSVLSMYRPITVRNRLPMPSVACDSELITSTKTRIGAIAFSAPTKTVPKMEITVACGTASARIIPITKPTTIRRIRLVSFHFFTKLPMFFPLL